MIGDLEIIPQKEIPYRSVILREMDLDAVLKRHPHTVIVDELAHTNVPGSRNRKRYEDVLELLDAGINVMTAVNIQHLETLNDAVSRSASTVIRETVPDSLLKRADEVVNVDVTVDELRDRLRQGKIYAPEKVEQSLANFFRKGNLNMLRELALRTTAEQVSRRASEYRRNQGLEQAPMPEKVMVCLCSAPAPNACCASEPESLAALQPTGMRSMSSHPTRTIATATPKPFSAWRNTSSSLAISAQRLFCSRANGSPTRSSASPSRKTSPTSSSASPPAPASTSCSAARCSTASSPK